MRRLLLAAVLAAAAQAAAQTASAQTAPTLFKVVSPRDEIVIALPATTLDAIAAKLVADGRLTAWQYAVRRDAQGTTEHGPLRRVAILRQDTTRIEAFDPRPLKVAPLPD